MVTTLFIILLIIIKIQFMKTKGENTNNLATPGKPMSQKKLVSLIKEAEEGPFYTIEESKKHFEEWRKKALKL